jgi:hypothetical protein
MCVGFGQGGTVIWENPNFDRSTAVNAVNAVNAARGGNK